MADLKAFGLEPCYQMQISVISRRVLEDLTPLQTCCGGVFYSRARFCCQWNYLWKLVSYFKNSGGIYSAGIFFESPVQVLLLGNMYLQYFYKHEYLHIFMKIITINKYLAIFRENMLLYFNLSCVNFFFIK